MGNHDWAQALLDELGLIPSVVEHFEDQPIAWGGTFSSTPNVWNHISRPDVLETLQPDDYVTVVNKATPSNMNALAIALGLDHVTYEPLESPALVYTRHSPDAVVLLFPTLVLSIGADKQETTAACREALERVNGMDVEGDVLHYEDGWPHRSGHVSGFVE